MREILHKPLSDHWLKAAVVGSLWASVEIIVGSFLHNLKVPFSGTILTSFSVFLIIAFFQVWKDAGIIWRAGLVCALMKSLSPSAVILGPMIGILSEAVIIWLFIVLFGKNLFAYILGGGLAVLSALFHKVGSLLILYGFHLVKIVEGLYSYAVKQLGIPDLDPASVILLVMAVYFIAGSVSAFLGYFAGKKHHLPHTARGEVAYSKTSGRNELFDHTHKQRYSLILLIGHLVFIVGCLWSLQGLPWYLSIPLCLGYIVGGMAWYRGASRFLKKKAFWIQFVLITLLASFLLEGYATGNFFSIQGLYIGLMMNLRAFVIMTGFAAISNELKNPLVKTVLYKKGFASLYQSLSLSFGALPDIIARLPEKETLIRNRKSFLSYLFKTSHELLERYRSEAENRPSVIIISGGVGKGKTTRVSEIIQILRGKGIRLAGLLSPGHFQNGKKEGFWLQDISTGQKSLFSLREETEGWVKFGHYYFDPRIINSGNEILSEAAGGNPDLMIIDEVGPMELHHGGWAPAIERICSTTNIPQLWAVRTSLVDKVARKWNVGKVLIFDIEEDSLENTMQGIETVLFRKEGENSG